MGNADTFAGPLVYNLFRILIHIATQSGKVGFGYVIEEIIEIVSLIRCVEITSEEQYQLIHQLRTLQYVFFQVIVDHMPHKATIHYRLPFGVFLSQYGIARLMESRHRAIYLQTLIDFAAQFPDRLIRI